MSDATPRGAHSGWRTHPLVQLTLVRYREFVREPEAVFWVFIFPLLLAAGLGIAFRDRPPERAPVGGVPPAPLPLMPPPLPLPARCRGAAGSCRTAGPSARDQAALP